MKSVTEDAISESTYLLDRKDTKASFEKRHNVQFLCLCIPSSWVLSSSLETPKNSVVSTLILLLNSMIGSGILAQPYVFMKAGIGLAICEYLIVGYMTYAGVQILIMAGEFHSTYSYSELSELLLGKAGGFIVDIAVVMGNLGSLLSYLIIVGSLAQSVFENNIDTEYYETLPYFAFMVSYLLSTPLCLVRQFGHLAFVSYFSIFAIISVMCLVIVGGPIYGSKNSSDSLNYVSFSGAVHSVGSVIFAFGFAPSVFHTYSGFDNKQNNLFRHVSGTTSMLGVCMCFLTGLVGYLSFRSSTQAEILDNFSGKGVGMVFKLLVILHLILFIPGDFVVMRTSLFRLCGIYSSKSSSQLSDAAHILSTLVITAVLTFVSCWIQANSSTNSSIPVVLDLTGGIAGSIMSFIIPGLLGVNSFRGIDYFISISLCIFGSCVPVVVVLSLFM